MTVGSPPGAAEPSSECVEPEGALTALSGLSLVASFVLSECGVSVGAPLAEGAADGESGAGGGWLAAGAGCEVFVGVNAGGALGDAVGVTSVVPSVGLDAAFFELQPNTNGTRMRGRAARGLIRETAEDGDFMPVI